MAELQQRRPTVRNPCIRNVLHLKACKRDGTPTLAVPIKGTGLRLLRYGTSGAPIEPEGVYSSTVWRTGCGRCALHGWSCFSAPRMHCHLTSVHCADCCVGFCSGVNSDLHIKQPEAVIPLLTFGQTGGQPCNKDSPEVSLPAFMRQFSYILNTLWIAPFGIGTGLGAGGTWCADVRSRKFDSRALPNAVAMLSGWNCTP